MLLYHSWRCTRSGMRRSTPGCCWSPPGRGARRSSGPSLPLLAIGIVERIAFNTSHFVALLEYRLVGAPDAVVSTAGGLPIDPMAHLTPGAFLSAPGLWLGLAVAAAFLTAAVRLRRYRA